MFHVIIVSLPVNWPLQLYGVQHKDFNMPKYRLYDISPRTIPHGGPQDISPGHFPPGVGRTFPPIFMNE